MLNQATKIIFIALVSTFTTMQGALAQADINMIRMQSLPANIRTITTTGSSEVLAVPNKVTVILAVKTFDKDLKTARTLNQQALKRVLELVPRYKISKNDVQTSSISIAPVYQSQRGGDAFPATPVAKPIGYSIDTTIGFIIHEPESTNSIISDALEVGANAVNSINFETTELPKYRDLARLEALRSAQKKAEAMAAELGMKLGKPLQIEDQGSSNTMATNAPTLQAATNGTIGPQGEDATFTTGNSSAPVQLGQLSIRSAVKTIFEME